MKKLTVLISIVCLVMANAGFTQNHWRVNNAQGIDADFTTVQDAFDAANDNDIVYIEGTNIPYAGASLSKPLTIIGPGYFLASNDSTQANLSSSIINNITLNATASGSYLAGLTIAQLTVGANNVIVERNNISTIYVGMTNTNVSNVIIRMNYLGSISDENNYNAYSTAVIRNNIITTYISTSNRAAWYIYNNTLFGNHYVLIQVCNSIIKNNIVQNTYPYEDRFCINTDITRNNTIEFNVCNKAPFNLPVLPNNIWDADMSQVFTQTGNNETRFYLIENSLAAGYGEGGIDCGAFGDATPYVLSGMPPVPHIFKATVPLSATPTSGLPVNVKIKSQK